MAERKREVRGRKTAVRGDAPSQSRGQKSEVRAKKVGRVAVEGKGKIESRSKIKSKITSKSTSTSTSKGKTTGKGGIVACGGVSGSARVVAKKLKKPILSRAKTPKTPPSKAPRPSTRKSPADVTPVASSSLYASGASFYDKLAALTRAGQAKTKPPGIIAFLSSVISDRGEDIMVRGYASWARDTIDPRPLSVKPQTFHVDNKAANASDANAGSKAAPWKTIQKAAETMRAGDTAIVHAGTYRECVRPFHDGAPDRMITYQAAPGEKVVIKAMDVWKPEWHDEGNGLWSAPYQHHPWDAPEKSAGKPENRTEQIFADGKLLRHLGNKDDVVKTPGTMFTDDQAHRIWVHLPHASPRSVRIERSVRQQCFTPAVRGLQYIKVAGFTMIGGAAHRWAGGNWHDIDQMPVLNVDAGRHWVIEDNTIEWGNAQGLGLGAGGFATPRFRIPIVHGRVMNEGDAHAAMFKENIGGYNTARRNRVNYHGISGIVGIVGTKGLLIEDNEVVGNCQKDNRGTCEEAGIKIHVMHDSIIRRNLIRDNDSFGIWIDANCATNRISQNILINNNDHAIFHEISPGPLLVDNNVIIDDRDKPASCGFYTHDGNGATVINNVIRGTKLGARVRALFHRTLGEGRMTTTNHNHFYNNVFIDNADGGLSLMPEVPRCEDNRSNGNIYWDRGAQPGVRIENTSDVGVQWESLPIGAALGFTGGGDKRVPLDAWARHVGNDTDAAVIPPRLLFGDLSPEAMREALVAAWKRRRLDLDGGYFRTEPDALSLWVGRANRNLEGWKALHTLWLAPDAGIQIWQTPAGLRLARWNAGSVDASETVHALEFARPPVEAPVALETLAAGDVHHVAVPDGWRIVETGLGAAVDGGSLEIRASAHQQAGAYGLILSNGAEWALVPVMVAPAYTLDGIRADRSDGNAVCVTISNHTNVAAEGPVKVALGKEDREIPGALGPHEQRELRIPVSCNDAGEATVSAHLGGVTLSGKKLLSFAAARRADTWEHARLHDINGFPGGVFPEGAEFGFLYQKGRLRAGWRARYGNDGLFVRVEAEHATHRSFRSDVDGVHCHDGVKIAVKGCAGDRATVVGMALRSDTGEQFLGFNKTANEKKYPIGKSTALKGSIVRTGELTVYEVLITWDMINRTGAPQPGTALPFSVFLSKDDGDQHYGLQWFFGIKYDEREGDEAWMGRLWFD